MLHWRKAWLRYWPWVAIPLLAVPACWTYTGGFPYTADGTLHLLRTFLLDLNIRQGSLYPRWVPQLVLGYGYPVFSFYGPTTFYLAEGLHLLGLGYYQAVDGAFVVMVVGAGYGMYLLAAAVLGEQAAPWAALVSAVAYMYAPYLLTNVFIRAAIGEVGAQALLPWIFWSFNRLLRHPQPGRWVLPLALSLGGLAATHNITLLFVPPALVAYGAMLWWQAGHDRRRLVWAVGGLVAAMGVGAFFWAPLIGERGYLARTAYEVAKPILPGNAWTWGNFLDGTFAFGYTFHIPFKLGLVQLTLAVIGLLLARRRDAEWLYWLLLAVIAGLGIGAWSIPIWLSNDVLLVAQFPWRLLTLVSVALALVTGGAVSQIQSRRWQAAGSLALLAVIMVANTPRLDPTTTAPIDNATIDQPALAQFETLTEALGTSSAHEFMPLWAAFAPLDPATATPALAATPVLTAVAAGPLQRVVEVASAAPSTLRFNVFYYPGWRATLDGDTPLSLYPSTNLGLLTVDLPAGIHQVRVVWQGTALEAWASYASLATLLMLTVFQWRQPDRWLAALMAALFVLGAVATFKPLPPPDPILTPDKPFAQAGLQLLGYRFNQPDQEELYLYPYWQTNQRQPPLRAHWRLTDASGKLVSEVALEPYFGGEHSDNWPANTLVGDAYRLPLPPGMPAGNFDLWLALEPLASPVGNESADQAHIANLALGAVPPATPPHPAQALNARFGDSITLAGYDLRLNQKATAAASRPLVRPGDELEYTLYWRALGPVAENYHGFVHLLDAHQNALIKQDQLPGSWFRPPVLWDPFHLQSDVYRLTVPADAPGGLYWPRLGLYRTKGLERLPIQDPAGQSLGSSLDLPPFKIVPPTPRPPEHLTPARFDDLATLWGYNLSLPPRGLGPGSTFTLTLYYRSTASGTVDYTRFVHLSGADGKVVAQSDAQPQQGVNPTSAWVPGEVIVDPIVLTVMPGTAAGHYTLSTGLYDPAAGGARLAVFDHDGNEMADDAVTLTTVSVAP